MGLFVARGRPHRVCRESKRQRGMTKLEQFSVQDAKFRRIDAPGESSILKETKLHKPIQAHHKRIAGWIDDYIASLEMAGIPIPKILEKSAEPEKLTYQCEFRVPNVIQLLEGRGVRALLDEREILDQVLTIIQKAQKSGLNFDPHIKNF